MAKKMPAEPKPKAAAAPAAGAKPKFGSPAWNAKYGVKKLGGGKKAKGM